MTQRDQLTKNTIISQTQCSGLDVLNLLAKWHTQHCLAPPPAWSRFILVTSISYSLFTSETNMLGGVLRGDAPSASLGSDSARNWWMRNPWCRLLFVEPVFHQLLIRLLVILNFAKPQAAEVDSCGKTAAGSAKLIRTGPCCPRITHQAIHKMFSRWKANVFIAKRCFGCLGQGSTYLPVNLIGNESFEKR